jgi:hypothetical protein
MPWSLSRIYRFITFSGIYHLRCPDGTLRTIYTDIDVAFPLFIEGWNAKLAAGLKASDLGTGELKGEYATKIEGLLFGLDELNRSLMMNFRSAYIAYSADPCANSGMLGRQIESIRTEQHRLQLLRLQIQTLATLAASKQSNHERIMDAFQEIVQRIGGPAVASGATAEISDNRRLMNKWIGESDDR